MRPNLFEIGTKELHQDAFFTWLIKWADPSCAGDDVALHQCGQAFVRSLIQSHFKENIGNLIHVEAGRQRENIDVWAEIYTEAGNYLIIIEDKVLATVHGEQLKVYKELAETHCREKQFRLVPVYLKTGSEPQWILHEVRQHGFSTILRKDVLALLKEHTNIYNDIFSDFLLRLQRMEADHQAFERLVPNEWTGDCWVGFYQYLETQFDWVKWHYVNPPDGNGFWNACLNWHQWTHYPVYLQIEQGDLCFKICVHPEDADLPEGFTRSKARHQWYTILMGYAKEKGFTEIRKPHRFGTGNYMTAAVVDYDCWLGAGDQLIDKEEAVKRLAKYKSFLVGCIKQVEEKEALIIPESNTMPIESV